MLTEAWLCRGPPDTVSGPRSKLAKLDPGVVQKAGIDRQSGATAEQAVDLDDDDDDDDVVIIEPGMQPPSVNKPTVKPSGMSVFAEGI